MLSWPVDHFADQFFNQSFYESAGDRLKKLATGVFESDNYTCKFCSFKCIPADNVWNAYFQLFPNDRNYKNITSNNLSTICSFCNSHFNMRASLNGGRYVPGVSPYSPTQLSILVKAVFSLRARPEKIADDADQVYKDVILPMTTSSMFSIMPNLVSPRSKNKPDPAQLKSDVARDFVSTLILLAEGGFAQKQSVLVLNEISPIPLKGAWDKESAYWYKHVYQNEVKSEKISQFLGRI